MQHERTTTTARTGVHAEHGVALLLTVMVLLMISAIGVTALNHAQNESVAGGSSRRKIVSLQAADSLLFLVRDQLAGQNAQFPNLSAIDRPTFMQNKVGIYTSARTGTMATSGAQPIQRVGKTSKEGGQLNVNSPNTFSYGIYRANVVAEDPSGGAAQLQAQYVINEGASGYK